MLYNEQKETEGQDSTNSKLAAEPNSEPPSYDASTSTAAAAAAVAVRTSIASSLTSPVAVEQPAGGPSTLSKASPALSTPSPSMRSNFTQISTPNRGINSNAVLDLALPQLPTPHPLPPISRDFTTYDGSRPNLYLSSQNHTVQASLQITDSSVSDITASPAKRAFIVADSESGNVTIEILSRTPSATLHICAESKNGNVIVRIPKDFHGPIKCRSNRLQQNPMYVRFTPRVRENMSMLSMHETEVYAFIGDASALQAQASGPPMADAKLPLPTGEQPIDNAGSSIPSPSTSTPGGTTSTWTGDQVEVIANNGRIKICYALLEGEEKEQEGELNTLVRYAQESGPIAGLFKFTARGVKKGFMSSKKKKEQKE